MATQRESLVVSALRALFESFDEFMNENNDDGGALSHDKDAFYMYIDLRI